MVRGYLAGRKSGEYVLSPEKTRKGLNKYRYDTGKRVRSHLIRCSVKASFHDMRRSFGSNRASAGESIYIIAAWLGDTIDVVQRSYGHLAPQAGTLIVEFESPRTSVHYDPLFAVRRVRAKLLPCKRCGHDPIFIESGLDWPIYPFSNFRQFLLWCDHCGRDIETSFDARKVPFRTRHVRPTYAKRVDLNLQPLQMVRRCGHSLTVSG